MPRLIKIYTSSKVAYEQTGINQSPESALRHRKLISCKNLPRLSCKRMHSSCTMLQFRKQQLLGKNSLTQKFLPEINFFGLKVNRHLVSGGCQNSTYCDSRLEIKDNRRHHSIFLVRNNYPGPRLRRQLSMFDATLTEAFRTFDVSSWIVNVELVNPGN